MKGVCLVIGAGAGIGGNVARRFAQEGYHACLCRRSDLDGLNKMVDTIKADGGAATEDNEGPIRHAGSGARLGRTGPRCLV